MLHRCWWPHAWRTLPAHLFPFLPIFKSVERVFFSSRKPHLLERICELFPIKLLTSLGSSQGSRDRAPQGNIFIDHLSPKSNQLSAVSRTHCQYPDPHHPCYHLRQNPAVEKMRGRGVTTEWGLGGGGVYHRHRHTRRKTSPIVSLRHLPLVCSLLVFIYLCL